LFFVLFQNVNLSVNKLGYGGYTSLVSA